MTFHVHFNVNLGRVKRCYHRGVAWHGLEGALASSLFRGVAGFWYVQVLDAIPDILIAPHFLYPRDAAGSTYQQCRCALMAKVMSLAPPPQYPHQSSAPWHCLVTGIHVENGCIFATPVPKCRAVIPASLVCLPTIRSMMSVEFCHQGQLVPLTYVAVDLLNLLILLVVIKS